MGGLSMRTMVTAETMRAQARQAVLALSAGDAPIVVGPFLGEVGYELLYWIPFVRWAVAFGKFDPARLWILSRGGCRSWYGEFGAQYLDIFDLMTPERFCALNHERIAAQGERRRLELRRGAHTAKQLEVSDFDRHLIAQVTTIIGQRPQVLHPSVMYQLLRPYWQRRGPNLYHEHADPQRLAVPPKLDGLPASYVAMKFYTSDACPDRRPHAKQVRHLLLRLLETQDVVTFADATVYDETHGSFAVWDHPRLHRVPLTPATNLATQTAVIAHAKGFVGTYGGFAYLAPLLGVPTTAFYARRNFRDDHLRLAISIFKGWRVRFDVRHLQQALERWEGKAHAAA